MLLQDSSHCRREDALGNQHRFTWDVMRYSGRNYQSATTVEDKNEMMQRWQFIAFKMLRILLATETEYDGEEISRRNRPAQPQIA